MTDVPDVTDASLDTSVFRRLVYADSDDADYAPLTRGATLALSYFVDAEVDAVRWQRGGEQSASDALRAACVMLPNPNALTKQHFIRAKHAQDALGFTRAERNQTDLWIIAQTAEYGLHLIAHDRRMARIAAAIGVPVVSLLPNIEQLLEADARRLSAIERNQPP